MHRFNIPYKLQDNDQLCFVHIPKTAGSALGDEITQHFPPDRIFHHPSWKIAAMMGLPLETRNRYQLVWAHNSYPEFRALQTTKQIFVSMLRHPVERIISAYYYIRRRPDHVIYAETMARSLEEFLAWSGHHETHDLQTRRLSGITDRTQDPNLDLACRTLRDKFIFVGLVERYEESLALLNFTFGWPPSEVKYINVTPERPRQSDLSPRVLKLLHEQNQNDILLYEYATRLFKEQLTRMKEAQELSTHQNAVYDTLEAHYAHYLQQVQNL